MLLKSPLDIRRDAGVECAVLAFNKINIVHNINPVAHSRWCAQYFLILTRSHIRTGVLSVRSPAFAYWHLWSGTSDIQAL